MPAHRRLAAIAAAVALLVAAVVVAVRAGGDDDNAAARGSGSSTSGSADPDSGADRGERGERGEGGDRGEGGGADDEGGGDGRQEAAEVRGEVPPATSPTPSPKASHSGTRKIPRVGPKGEVVPVPTDAGPGETLGKDGSVAIKEGALVSKPLPETASSRGRLVRGYPSDVLPTIPGSQVRSSSVSSSSRGVQVAFTGSATLKAEAIAAHYRLALAPYGFTESAVPAVGGSTALGFNRGSDSLVLTTTPAGKRTTYSLFGVLRAGSD